MKVVRASPTRRETLEEKRSARRIDVRRLREWGLRVNTVEKDGHGAEKRDSFTSSLPDTSRARQYRRDGRPLTLRLTAGARSHQRLWSTGGRSARSGAHAGSEERAHSHQIVRRVREGEDPRHLLSPAMMQLAQAAVVWQARTSATKPDVSYALSGPRVRRRARSSSVVNTSPRKRPARVVAGRSDVHRDHEAMPIVHQHTP